MNLYKVAYAVLSKHYMMLVFARDPEYAWLYTTYMVVTQDHCIPTLDAIELVCRVDLPNSYTYSDTSINQLSKMIELNANHSKLPFLLLLHEESM